MANPDDIPIGQDSEMTSLQLVRMLLEVQSAVNSQRIAEILRLPELQQHDALMKIAGEIHSLLQTIAEEATCFEDLHEPLSSEEYILPPELESIHPGIIAHLSSDKTNESRSHAGLLLFGIRGSGKTEYARHLAHETLGHTRFVTIHISDIRNAASPGTMLLQVYRDLEERAQKEGVYYVAFFDEFDKLINKFSMIHKASSFTEDSSSSDKRSNSHTQRSTQESFQVDDTGEELLSTLKTILSGTGNIKRVFTIATTNQTALPEEMVRAGRLQEVHMLPFGMNQMFVGERSTTVPVYTDYTQKIPRILRIMNAINIRLCHAPHPVFTQMLQEIDAFFAEDWFREVLEEKNEANEIKKLYGYTAKDKHGNFLILQKLLAYLDVDFSTLHSKIQEGFGGSLDRRGNVCFSTYRGTPDELSFMQGLTPATVAAYFKEHQEKLSSIETAKRCIAECIFPQLRSGWLED